VADDGWEARMTARARERRPAAVGFDHAAHFRRLEAEGRAHAGQTQTLAEAIDLLGVEPWACACIGPPWCCVYRFQNAVKLQAFATYAARLVVARMEKLSG
jgi:hypothetical protein